MENRLAEAEEAVERLLLTRQDRWYPVFHIAPKAGWLNDPNGLTYFKDRYQVYFQHHPYSTVWGPMHWGHVSSEDMVTWKREPIAFAPSVEEDRDGVFSGSAVVGDDGETLYAYYTGHRWRNGVNEDEGNLQVQMMATSKDGVTFHDKKMIVDSPPGLLHFRDPKVWKMGETWYMVFGASSAESRGQVWLYTSADMEEWSFDRVLFEDPDEDVFMLECPDFFPLGDHWVLQYGPMGSKPKGYVSRNAFGSGYVVGNWTAGGNFEPITDYRMADWGHNYYAPQTFETPDGRRVVFGWMGAFTLPLASQEEDGWSGQLTVPRSLRLDENLRLVSKPLEELSSLRSETIDFGSFEVATNETFTLSEDVGPVEIEAEFDLDATTSERIGFLTHKTPTGEHTLIGYDDLAGTVFIDRRLAGNGDKGYRAVDISDMAAGAVEAGEPLKLRVFIDNGSVEVFVNDGREVASSLIFPADGARALQLAAESGSIKVNSLKLHTLNTIWETPDR